MITYHESVLENNPQCSHGPTLLFSRKIKENDRKFYACSAYRDRKHCSFFLYADENITKGKQQHFEIEKNELMNDANKYNNISSEIKKDISLHYCNSCDILFCKPGYKMHKNHDVTKNVDKRIKHPTKILRSKVSEKGESQYHFTDKTCNMIINLIKQIGTNRCLCIGCPSIFECISSSTSSFLLDIDHRFKQFYNSEQFLWFNMYNGYSFESDEKYFQKWLKFDEKITFVIDPPFGGRLEPLATTLKRLIELSGNQKVSIMLVLPYFMEKVVKLSFPDFHMLDYSVEYENHRDFGPCGDGKKKSPVRIFSNISPTEFVLPVSEGYKHCEICNKWISKENSHCFICNDCTSKNGAKYKHCNICEKCVKQTWAHCETCNICKLVGHICIEMKKVHGRKQERENRKVSKKRKH